jgi:hypothetical protein
VKKYEEGVEEGEEEENKSDSWCRTSAVPWTDTAPSRVYAYLITIRHSKPLISECVIWLLEVGSGFTADNIVFRRNLSTWLQVMQSGRINVPKDLLAPLRVYLRLYSPLLGPASSSVS